MKIIEKIKDIYKNKISYKYQDEKKIEKLSIPAKVLIFILNIFIITIITLGIEFQTNILNSPQTKIPYECLSNINNNIDNIKNNEKIFDIYWYKYDFDRNLNNNFRNNNYSNSSIATKQVYNEIKDKEQDQRCSNIDNMILDIKNNIEFQKTYIEIKKIDDILKIKNKELEYIKNNYDTTLFEKIANQNEAKSILNNNLNSENIKEKFDNLNNEIINYENNRKKLDEIFKNSKELIKLNSYILENKVDILKENEKLKQSYFIKKHLLVIAFILPMVIFFFYKMQKENINQNYTKYMISKNILFITSFFLIINCISLINNFIPHYFIKNFLMFFYNLNIPFIFYYILMIVAVILFSYFISKIQNKKQEKTNINFIENYEKNICSSCNIKVDYIHMNNCPNCGNELKRKCGKCNSFTIKSFNCCFNCGDKENL